MEIGVSLKSLEHVTPRIDCNLATGWVRTVTIRVGVIEYRYFFGGLLADAAGWYQRCTLYADSAWQRSDPAAVALLNEHAGIDTLTAENAIIIERVQS